MADAFDSVIKSVGKNVPLLLKAIYDKAVQEGLRVNRLDTAYINTIPVEDQPSYPGDLTLERKIRAIISLQCGGDGDACQQNDDDRRSPSDVCLKRDVIRNRF